MFSLRDNILFIAGPEKDGWECLADDARIAKAGWEKSRVRFTSEGDGSTDLNIKGIAAAVAKQPEGTLIIVDAHGNYTKDGHLISIDNGPYSIPTLRLMEKISKKAKARYSIISF